MTGILQHTPKELHSLLQNSLVGDSNYINDVVSGFMSLVGYTQERVDKDEKTGAIGFIHHVLSKKESSGAEGDKIKRKLNDVGLFKNRQRNAAFSKNKNKKGKKERQPDEREVRDEKTDLPFESHYEAGAEGGKSFINDYQTLDPRDVSKVLKLISGWAVEIGKGKDVERYDRLIVKHLPKHIDTLKQEDVDKPYIQAVNTYRRPQDKKTDYDQLKTFVAITTNEPPYAQRSIKDVLRRIERQNDVIMKGYQSPLEVVYIAMKMAADGKFNVETRKSLALVVDVYCRMIMAMHGFKMGSIPESFNIRLSAWSRMRGRRKMYVVRIDSNAHLRMSLLAQSMYAIISVDGYDMPSTLRKIMNDVIVFQVVRSNYADDIKNLTNVISLYMGKDGVPTSKIHKHPVYGWTIDELRASDGMTWRQPTTCGGCDGGLFKEASNLRTSMFEDVIKKAVKTLPDLFDEVLFPNFKNNVERIMGLQYNENMLLISRTFIMMNVSLYVNSPGAEGLIEEINNVNSFKKKSDEYRKENPEEYKNYTEAQHDKYKDLIYKSIMNSKITPADVANNLEAYTTTKSGALPRIKLEIDLRTKMGVNTINTNTGAKVAYLAFMENKNDISTKYIETESRADYLRRVAKGDRGTETWRYNSIGSRLDIGRQRRHIYNESLQLYQLENIATEPTLNGFTGYRDDSGEGLFSKVPRPEGILTNTQRAQNTMIALFAQIPFDKKNIIFSTDASSFDKASRAEEHHVLFYKVLLEIYMEYNKMAEWMRILPITIDGKRVGLIDVIQYLIKLFSTKQTYVLKDEWSSVAVNMDYTPSGSKITFAQNSFSNLVVQDFLRVIYNDIIYKRGLGVQLYTAYTGVAGDDAATVMSVLQSNVITEEMLSAYSEALERLSLLTGYEMAPTKGGVCTTEVAKIFTTIGFVIQHKPTTIASEKESTAEDVTSRVTRMSVVATLTSERNLSTHDSILFCRALGMQRLSYDDYDEGIHETIQLGELITTLPSSMGGSGMPIWTYMNEQWSFLAKVLGQEELLTYLLGVAETFKETSVREMRKSIEKTFLEAASDKAGVKGLRATNTDMSLGISEKNIKGFFKGDERRLANSLNAKSKLGRTVAAMRELDQVTYDRSQERKIKELASTVRLTIKQEKQLFAYARHNSYEDFIRVGKSTLRRLYTDDPVYNAMQLVDVSFGEWKENFQIVYPSQHKTIKKIVAHYGINTDQAASYDYMHKIRIIIAKYATVKPAMSPPSDITFITTLLNSGIDHTLDGIMMYMVAVFGLDPLSIDQNDLSTILKFLSTPNSFAHMSEASTVSVFISNRVLDVVQIISSSLVSNKNYIRMLKSCLVNMMILYDRPILSIRLIMSEEFKEQTRYFQDKFFGWNLFMQERDL